MYQMDIGGIGALFLSVVSPAEEGINLKSDSVTVQHPLVEEQIAQEKIPTAVLATFRNALLVKKCYYNTLGNQIISNSQWRSKPAT
jgi:hypothetical protein